MDFCGEGVDEAMRLGSASFQRQRSRVAFCVTHLSILLTNSMGISSMSIEALESSALS